MRVGSRGQPLAVRDGRARERPADAARENPYEPPSERAQVSRQSRRPQWGFIVACVFALLLVALVVAGKLIARDMAPSP